MAQVKQGRRERGRKPGAGGLLSGGGQLLRVVPARRVVIIRDGRFVRRRRPEGTNTEVRR